MKLPRQLVFGCALLTGALLGSAVHAQSLSLGDALRAAVYDHPSVIAKRSERDSAERGVAGAEWQRFPAVTFGTSRLYTGDLIGTAAVQQPLWAGGRITANIDASKARLSVADASLVEAQRAIMVKTASAYAELLRTRKRLLASEQNVAEHRRLYEMIERRSVSEVNPEVDVVLARSRLQQALAEKIQFESQAANAESVLSQIIGRPIRRNDVAQVGPLPIIFRSVQEAFDAALNTNPVLMRLQAQERSAEADIDAKRAAYWPQVSARAERIFGGPDSVFTGTNTRDRAYVVVEVQPGAGLSAMSNVQAAVAAREAARSSMETTRREVIDEVNSQWNEVVSMRGQIKPLQQLDAGATEVVLSYLRQFTVGRKSWQDVLNAQRESAQARYSLADVESSLLLSTIKLAVSTGNISADSIDLQ